MWVLVPNGTKQILTSIVVSEGLWSKSKWGVICMDALVSKGTIKDFEADTLIISLFEDGILCNGPTKEIDDALSGSIKHLTTENDFTGKLGEIAVLYPQGVIPARRVILVGLGPKENFGLEIIRHAAAAATRRAQELGSRRLAGIVNGADIAGFEVKEIAQAIIEGSLLALYQYGPRKAAKPESFTIVESKGNQIADIKIGARAAQAIGEGVKLTRDLVNAPPNIATPTYLAEIAHAVAKLHGMNILVGDRAWITEQNLGAMLAVTQGARREPAFINLEHNPLGTKEAPIVLVGKGITFDSGGLSLKTPTGMLPMKTDMAGAGAVLGVMDAIGQLQLPVRVIALAPCTENMPDGTSYRPGDVIKASDDTFIEIVSTDAEGRMVLADALHFAKRYHPKAVIDLATLTGTAASALGRGVAASLFSNSDSLARTILNAGTTTNEKAWRMPLFDEYRHTIKSPVADIKNSGGPAGGIGTSAVFLEHFTNYPWAHLDIAGMARNSTAGPYTPAGATGYGVRLIIEWLRQGLN